MKLQALTNGKTIRYTLDGSEPDMHSPYMYETPIPFR